MPSREAIRASLERAYQALADDDAGEAERRAKAVSAIVRAEQDVAQLLAEPDSPDDDAETLRAQLRSRFRRLAEAEHAGAPAEVLEHITAETPSR